MSTQTSTTSQSGFDKCQYEYSGGVRCCTFRNCHNERDFGHEFKESSKLWHVRQTSPGASRSIFDSEGRLIANAISEDFALQIVADHNEKVTRDE